MKNSSRSKKSSSPLLFLWRYAVEPLLRFWPGYPPDWERRRMLAFERAAGRCEACGMPAGSIAPGPRGWRVAVAHVHHVLPISRGGRHGLANLRLLCVKCHSEKHPENVELRGGAYHRDR